MFSHVWREPSHPSVWAKMILSFSLLPSIAIYCHLQDAHLRWEDIIMKLLHPVVELHPGNILIISLISDLGMSSPSIVATSCISSTSKWPSPFLSIRRKTAMISSEKICEIVWNHDLFGETETKIHKAPKRGLCDRPTSINKYHLEIIIATLLWEIGVALFLGLPHYCCGRLAKPRTKAWETKRKIVAFWMVLAMQIQFCASMCSILHLIVGSYCTHIYNYIFI